MSKTRIHKLERQVHKVDAVLARARLAKLPEELARYTRTKVVPTEPMARAFVELQESFGQLVAKTICGSDAEFEQARQRYADCLTAWEQLLSRKGIV